jgi:hypothetical protein
LNVEIDTLVRLGVAFSTVVGGTPTNPGDVKILVKAPNGAITTFTFLNSQVIRDSTGMFHFDLLVNAVGAWAYKWQGTGAGVQVTSPDQVTLMCNATVFAPPLP